MRADLSIAKRLTLFITVLMLVIMTLAAAAVVGLHVIDEQSETLEREILVSTQILGQLDSQVSKFRVAEEYRAVAADTIARLDAEQILKERRQEIAALRERYRNLQSGPRGNSDLSEFDRRWSAYMAEHDAWLSRDFAGTLDDPARYRSTLHRLYVAADDAVDEVIAENTRRGDSLAASVDRLVHDTIALTVALSMAGILVALLLLLRIRRDITAPLSAITRALAALAGGDRIVIVPSRNRHDEIGRMVDAFEVFRANAFALEQAHEAARRAQEYAQALARHDPLTGLPNRRVFEAEIDRAVANARDGRDVCSLLMIDLDRFKPINDQLGHPVGDLVLCEVARRLTTLIDADGIAARLGGDEFAIVLAGPADRHAASLTALGENILEAMHAPMDIAGNPIRMGATIGIASCPADGMDRETLMRAADLALYRAKRDGRGRISMFERGMEIELQQRAALETDLRAAIAADAIKPQYQPLVTMRDRTIYGFEMLPQWDHPARGPVPAEHLIHIAGQCGLLPTLTWQLLRQACRDAGEWPGSLVLTISLSAAQLRDPALPTRLLTILNQENFPATRLEIAISEAALATDPAPIELILVALQSAGIRIALDDFGTGYSSLCGLTTLHFDRVKIDGSFAATLASGERGTERVGSVLSMATSLGRSTGASGVEAAETARTLSALGCDIGQGHLFGGAAPAVDIRRLIDVMRGGTAVPSAAAR